MAEYTCNADFCNRKFDDKEKELTNDEHKCILHCEKNNWKESDTENIDLFESLIIQYIPK